MSKRSEREAAAALATSEAETRQMLFEYDQRLEARAELDRQHRQQILAEAKQQLAQDHLEAAAAELDVYRATAIAQATSAKTIAPQFVAFITGTSREEIDAQIEQAKAATAEIVAEVAGQGEPRASTFEQGAETAVGPGREADMRYRLANAQRGTVERGATREDPLAAQRGTDRADLLRDAQGRFVSEEIVIDKNLSMRDYIEKVRPALNINERDRGIFG